MSSADDRERLDEINDALSTGVTENTVDGETHKQDLKHLRRQKAQLEVKLGIRKRRRRVFGFNMGSR